MSSVWRKGREGVGVGLCVLLVVYDSLCWEASVPGKGAGGYFLLPACRVLAVT